jgi:hypothetical protein
MVSDDDSGHQPETEGRQCLFSQVIGDDRADGKYKDRANRRQAASDIPGEKTEGALYANRADCNAHHDPHFVPKRNPVRISASSDQKGQYPGKRRSQVNDQRLLVERRDAATPSGSELRQMENHQAGKCDCNAIRAKEYQRSCSGIECGFYRSNIASRHETPADGKRANKRCQPRLQNSTD